MKKMETHESTEKVAQTEAPIFDEKNNFDEVESTSSEIDKDLQKNETKNNELSCKVLNQDESDSEEKIVGVSEEIANEKLKEALENQTPKKRKKTTIISLCLLLVNIVFMVFIIKGLIGSVGDTDFASIVKSQGKKLWWLVGGLIIYALYILSQVLMYYALIKDITGKKRKKLSYDVAVIGKYYDNVTPLAVGGQPMQIVKLAENGISAGVATSIPIIKLMINSAVNIVLVLLFFIFGLPNIPLSTPFNDLLLIILEVLGVIGLVLNLLMVVFMFLVSTGNFVSRSLVSSVVRLGYKLKIVKNYRVTLKKTLNQVAEYKTSVTFLWKHKKLFFKMIGLAIMECLTYAVMPYFVVMAFAPSIEFSPLLFLFICITKYYICSMASSFIPLPGGTGLMEISFIFLFGVIVKEHIVWALLFYRFISYYLILLHGFIHELISIFGAIYKSRKQAKNSSTTLEVVEEKNVDENLNKLN